MRQFLLTRIIGSKWRTFCGMSSEEFLTRATDTLEQRGYDFEYSEYKPTSGEMTMFGSGDTGERLQVTAPVEFEVDILAATADPLARFSLGFVLGEEERRDATGGLCIVTIRPVTSETRPAIAAFISDIVAEGNKPPWRVDHHVSMRLAVLLRVKIRLLWTYWLNVDTPDEPRVNSMGS